MGAIVNLAAMRARILLPALALAMTMVLTARAALAEIRVTASIPPIHSLAAQVMAGVGAPRLLIPAGTSPHGFSLTPSQARMLADADVVIWIGPALETALARPMATLARQARLLTLAAEPALVRYPARRLGEDHDHGHDHGGEQGLAAEDPHYWLDPVNAQAMIAAIARSLALADPENANRYAANADAAIVRLDALMKEFQARLATARDRPFVVFHDAYQYLEKRFGLHTAGVLAIDPDRPAGARHVAELRDRIRHMNVACLFTEPQFSSRLTGMLIEGTQARVGVLDPLGNRLVPGPDLYRQMTTANLTSLAECLGGTP